MSFICADCVAAIVLPTLVNSARPIKDNNEVSLIEIINCLMIEGYIVLKACGKTIFFTLLP